MSAGEPPRIVTVPKLGDLDFAIQRLHEAKNPEDVFGEFIAIATDNMRVELRSKYNVMARALHPDNHGGVKAAQEAMALLNVWRDKADEKLTQGRWGQKDSGVVIEAGRKYKNVTYLTSGDICDVYLSEREDGIRAVIKIVIDTKDQDFVQNEATILKRLWESKDPSAIHFQKYLPKLLEQTRVKIDGKEKPANIIQMCEQGYTLEQVHQKHQFLDPRNVAWIWKRMLEGISWVHNRGIKHGAILPSHVIVYPKNHGICLIDWSYASEKSPIKAISTKYKHFYPPEVFKKVSALPSMDIYMVAKCIVYLLGGDPETNYVSDQVPVLLRGFLEACLLPNPLMRYIDAWRAMDQLNDNLRLTFGPRKFVELEM